LFALLATTAWTTAVRAQGADCSGTPRCLADLKKFSHCELARLFDQATVSAIPTGDFDGALLQVCDAKFPRLRVWGSNFTWRGKVIFCDAHFINRWIGGHKWIESHFEIGPSWWDGKPAIVGDYAPGTPVFGNTRDELRELGPGLYLGVIYDRCPCPRQTGFIGLECRPVCGCK